MAVLVLNGVIGSGIFVLPGTLGRRLGWASLISWTIAAALTATMVFSFAEVASRFAGSGGASVLHARGVRPFVGLQVGWLSYFVRVISAAVQANLFTAYLAGFVPWASTRVGGLVVNPALIGFLAAIDIRSLVSGTRASNTFALLKIAPLVALGILGVAWIARLFVYGLVCAALPVFRRRTRAARARSVRRR